jgi:lipoprotein LprG
VREARPAHPSPGRREGAPRGHRRIVALIIALPVAACGGGGKQAPAPPARTIVAKALARTTALRSFHFVLKVEHAPSGAPGLTLTLANGDLLAPDQLRARINGTFGRTPIQTEIVISGSRSFLKDPLTKQWHLFAAGTNPAVFIKGVPSVIRLATGVRNTGSDTVGGQDSYRLQWQVRSAEVASLVGVKPGRRLVPITVWVDKAHYYLRRIRLEGPVADGEPRDIVRTVELSRFDEPVTIALPQVSG